MAWRSWRWRLARTAPSWPPPAQMAWPGSGTSQPVNCSPSLRTVWRSWRWRLARTAPSWPPPAWMARLGCGPRDPGETVTLSAEVLVADPISATQAAQLVDDFKAIGLGADVRLIPARRSANDVAWLVLAALPVQPFLNQLAGDL